MAVTKISSDYKKILDKVPLDRKLIAEKLIKELMFLEETLELLKQAVREGGAIEHFQQGSQDFMRTSPALTAYNTSVQRYSVMYRQLTDLLGKDTGAEVGNAVYQFIKEG